MSTSGEGMAKQDDGRLAGRSKPMRAMMSRAALGAACLAFAVSLGAPAQAADDDSTSPSKWEKFMQTLGLKRASEDTSGINYTERSPLVVPPTRDLPPPVAELPPAAGWPQDPVTKPHPRTRSRPVQTPAQAPMPTAPATADAAAGQAAPNGQAASNGQPGQVAPNGQAGQTGQAGQASQAGQPGQAGQAGPAGQPPASQQRVPNPVVEKKSVWNPKTWFSSEEYANFSTEPERDTLTDPPAGYRTPSPEQPYGLGPEKKKAVEGSTSPRMGGAK